MRAVLAWLPVAMSLLALGIVLLHVATAGSAREPDEGTAAHLWQLLMSGQAPIVAAFLVIEMPQAPRQTLSMFAIQVAAGLAALAPVFILQL